MSAEVSHGRGGAGNINKDDTVYVDGEIVRAGPEGSHGDGAYSTGRGGAANIADAGKANATRADTDAIPEAAYRPSTDGQDYHTGRGGAGNSHVVDKVSEGSAPAAPTAPISLADKLKSKILGAFKK